jgi:hypothetical protein
MARQHRPDDEAGHQTSADQVRDEPVPASRHADRAQQAAERSEETQRADAEAHQDRPTPEDRSPALESMSTPDRSSRDRPGDQPDPGPGQPDDDAEPGAGDRPG